jgi:hypothetical protein
MLSRLLSSRLPLVLLVLGSSACSFVLDFDDLQTGSVASGGSGGAGAATGGAGASPAQGGVRATGGSVDVGGDAGQGGAPDEGIGLDAAPAALAAAVCDQITTCVGSAAMNVIFADEKCAVATEQRIANTIVAAIDRSEREGAIDYDGSSLPDCIEDYSNLACEDVSVRFPEGCKEAIKGLSGEGATCAHALECEPELYCDLSSCACKQLAADGDACLASDECAAGLACFMGACAPLGAEGEACEGGVAPACLTGLVCVNADAMAMLAGRCFPTENLFIASEGQACNFGDPPTLCREGLSCPFRLLFPTCVATAEPGGACELALPDMCPEGEYCSSGICTPAPGPGEPCATGLVAKRNCAAYARCVSGTCRLLGDNGNTCVSAEECWSGVCTAGKCAAPHCE